MLAQIRAGKNRKSIIFSVTRGWERILQVGDIRKQAK